MKDSSFERTIEICVAQKICLIGKLPGRFSMLLWVMSIKYDFNQVASNQDQFVNSDIFVEKFNNLAFLTNLISLHSLCEILNQSNLSVVLKS